MQPKLPCVQRLIDVTARRRQGCTCSFLVSVNRTVTILSRLFTIMALCEHQCRYFVFFSFYVIILILASIPFLQNTIEIRNVGLANVKLSQLRYSSRLFANVGDEMERRLKNSPVRFLSQPNSSVYQDNVYYGVPMKNKTFTLLLLRPRNGFRFKPHKDNFSKCPYSNCKLTTNASQLPEADAVLTHMGNVSKRMFPAKRKPSQLWIAFLRESEQRHFRKIFKDYNGLFNATSFSERSSDIFNSYGYYDRRTAPAVDVKRINVSRPKLVAWFVSNCQTPSRREHYVRELQKHIDVDVYGRCGQLSCNKSKRNSCHDMLDKTYKFYLSFENSLCVDYLTEKVWDILKLNIVPVVLGGADYKEILPPNSYIDVRDIKSPKNLADYLHILDSNDQLYRQYFEWKRRFQIRTLSPWCQFCAFMNRVGDNSTRMVVDRLDKFYDPGRHCVRSSDYYTDPNVLKMLPS